MTFLEALRAKIFDKHGLVQRHYVWKLDNLKIGTAIFDHATPTADDILRMAEAREHCQRLLVIAPAFTTDDQLQWLHSQLVDGFVSSDIVIAEILKAIDADFIITGKNGFDAVPKAFRAKLFHLS